MNNRRCDVFFLFISLFVCTVFNSTSTQKTPLVSRKGDDSLYVTKLRFVSDLEKLKVRPFITLKQNKIVQLSVHHKLRYNSISSIKPIMYRGVTLLAEQL